MSAASIALDLFCAIVCLSCGDRIFARIANSNYGEMNVWKHSAEIALQDKLDTYWKPNGIAFGIKSISYCATLTLSIDINWFH